MTAFARGGPVDTEKVAAMWAPDSDCPAAMIFSHREPPHTTVRHNLDTYPDFAAVNFGRDWDDVHDVFDDEEEEDG